MKNTFLQQSAPLTLISYPLSDLKKIKIDSPILVTNVFVFFKNTAVADNSIIYFWGEGGELTLFMAKV